MLSTCLACARSFPQNDQLEHMPSGRRLAFDPGRGRLWVICSWCGHWSLVPLEARWEAVAELEKSVRDTPNVVSRTDQVALMQVGALEIIRIGPALTREETWWRYGTVLRGRRLRHARVIRTGGAIAAATTVTMLGAFAFVLPEITALKWRSVREVPGRARRRGEDAAESLERWFRYGRVAWEGSARCDTCGHTLARLEFKRRGTAFLERDGSVRVRCQNCRAHRGWHVIDPLSAEPLVRRLLAYENVAGASDAQLDSALDLIRSGTIISDGSLPFRNSPPLVMTALEIVHAHAFERAQLNAELRDIENRWRAEEELARIIDRELTPMTLHTGDGGGL